MGKDNVDMGEYFFELHARKQKIFDNRRVSLEAQQREEEVQFFARVLQAGGRVVENITDVSKGYLLFWTPDTVFNESILLEVQGQLMRKDGNLVKEGECPTTMCTLDLDYDPTTLQEVQERLSVEKL